MYHTPCREPQLPFKAFFPRRIVSRRMWFDNTINKRYEDIWQHDWGRVQSSHQRLGEASSQAIWQNLLHATSWLPLVKNSNNKQKKNNFKTIVLVLLCSNMKSLKIWTTSTATLILTVDASLFSSDHPVSLSCNHRLKKTSELLPHTPIDGCLQLQNNPLLPQIF